MATLVGGGKNVCCSVSGGADSDILIDLCERVEPHFVSYVFFDTGIEYQATKEHLDWLEQKYGIEIHREKAKVPVPCGCFQNIMEMTDEQWDEAIEGFKAQGCELF